MKTKILLFFLFSNLFGASDGHLGDHHKLDLSLFYVLPFIGMLLSIAVLPLTSPHFWEKNYGKIALFWALTFYLPFLIIEQKFDFAIHELFKVILTEYLPFIILLFSLYTIFIICTIIETIGGILGILIFVTIPYIAIVSFPLPVGAGGVQSRS